jgi:hypothetical protein
MLNYIKKFYDTYRICKRYIGYDKDILVSKEAVSYKDITEIKVNNRQLLSLVDIPKFIDIDKLKNLVKEDIDANKYYYDDLGIIYTISNPKKAEWILNRSIKNGKLIGNGNSSMDIITDENDVIDVGLLTLNNIYTNEKSIIQITDNNIDELFKKRSSMSLIRVFKNKLKDKYDKYMNNNIYYIIFICHDKNIHLACFKLNIKNINNIRFGYFTQKSKSLIINNIIDKKDGLCKIYGAKKRMELRLSKNIIDTDKSIKIY